MGDDPHDRFMRLYDAHAADLRRYLRRRCDPNDVDDLLSDVFLTAWRRIEEMPEGVELPWLYRTAWNTLANHRRRPLAVVTDVVPDEAEPDIADRISDDAVLASAWHTLSARDREVLRLAAWEGLDGRELAAALGISVSGAGAALWRARQHLTEAWEAAERSPSPETSVG